VPSLKVGDRARSAQNGRSHRAFARTRNAELRARADAWIAEHPDAFAALRQGTRGGGHPTLSLPVRAKAGFDDSGLNVVNYFVDQDLTPFSPKDWICATRTYDWAFGNHEGTDYVL
jgi:hypothetical protein